MGYFTNLYIVDIAEVEGDKITVRTEVYGGPHDRAYFCWGTGERPANMHSYAYGTVVCDKELALLTGYPAIETHSGAESLLIEASFNPMGTDDAVLFHFVLPERFIPRRDLEPLEQPTRPFVYLANGRIVVTYPTQGRKDARIFGSGSRDCNHPNLWLTTIRRSYFIPRSVDCRNSRWSSI